VPTPTFMRVSLAQFEHLLKSFDFTRRITAVHMHHTWRPGRAQFAGHATIVAMWRHHTETNGWRDIAQHVTIDPEGGVWLGRNWNLAPASAAGFNGNSAAGPFMFEMVGNFDVGFDPFDGPQRESALGVIASVQEHFDLPHTALQLHNEMSSKSCPGTSIQREQVLKDVEERRQQLRGRGAPVESPRSPFPQEEARLLQRALQALRRTPPGYPESGDAEDVHDSHGARGDHRDAASDEAAPSSGLDRETLTELRPHLVNLEMGRLSDDGELTSSTGDVDAIFEEHLPRWLKQVQAVAPKPARIVLFAHGGLVSEGRGLQIAHKHVQWWLDNGVYPIYFVWETGFFETIGQLLERTRQRGARDVFDFTTDPLIEVAARALQGPRIWGGMKSSAEHAVDEPTEGDAVGGGARYAARKLAKFCADHAGAVELHAAGHSAGAIFQAHFLPVAIAEKVPRFKTVHFLAPAIRTDEFKRLLMRGIDQKLEHLTMYTMHRDTERNDDCARIYRKSLLYLIHYALEARRPTPILGLEESVRKDTELRRLFGLGLDTGSRHEVIWSPSPSDTGSSASRSVTHGGFDDDPATMNSIVRRVLDKADADPIKEYRQSRALERDWIDEVDWPDDLQPPRPGGVGVTPPSVAVASLSTPVPAPAPAWPGPPSGAGPSGGGTMRALCVGINAYPRPEQRLSGCVHDSERWSQALRSLGFQVETLQDYRATRRALEQSLGELVTRSRPGDVIVFQFAGHGTHVQDLNGDEPDERDEALCPVDFADGRLYIDDDISELFAKLPHGVNMTCFMDCCHSGTNTRFAVGRATRAPGPGAKPRYVIPTLELEAAHREFRGGARAPSPASGTGGPERMRDIKFSACRDDEVAWEIGQSGEFTERAMRIFAAGVQGMSNGEFLNRVLRDFGAGARQRPMLDCAEGVDVLPLLQPLGALQSTGSGRAAMRAGAGTCVGAGLPAETLHLLSQAICNLSRR